MADGYAEALIDARRERRSHRCDRALPAHRQLRAVEKDAIAGILLRRNVGYAATWRYVVSRRNALRRILPRRQARILAKSATALFPRVFAVALRRRDDCGRTACVNERAQSGRQHVRFSVQVELRTVVTRRAEDADAEQRGGDEEIVEHGECARRSQPLSGQP